MQSCKEYLYIFAAEMLSTLGCSTTASVRPKFGLLNGDNCGATSESGVVHMSTTVAPNF